MFIVHIFILHLLDHSKHYQRLQILQWSMNVYRHVNKWPNYIFIRINISYYSYRYLYNIRTKKIYIYYILYTLLQQIFLVNNIRILYNNMLYIPIFIILTWYTILYDLISIVNCIINLEQLADRYNTYQYNNII